MKNILLFTLFLNCALSCKSQQIEEEANVDFKSSDLPGVLEYFTSVAKEVNKVYKDDTTKLELYIQLDSDGSINRVLNFNDTPESYSASYNIIRNNAGQIIYIAEFPACESGDWDLIYESYFDTSGNLVAFIRKSSFFNSGCAEIVREKSEYYFDLSHELIKKTYQVADGDWKKLEHKDCHFLYRFDYTIHKTLKEYLKKYKFKN